MPLPRRPRPTAKTISTRPARRPARGAAACLLVTAVAGCTAAGPAAPATSSSSGTTTSAQTSVPTVSPTPTPTPTASPTTTPKPTATPTPTAAGGCAPAVVARMSPAQRAGQLLMVGLDSGAGRTSLDGLVTGRHLGGIILLGGWTSGADAVRATTRHLAGLASPTATANLGLLLAADQEGGQVQQLRGAGFSRMPSALVQGQSSPGALTASATTWGRQLAAAGINVNLAPVADTVPSDLGRANGPIGRYDRQYSSDPDRVATMSAAFAAGMRAGGVATTAKHFPGIGRITGNTDVTATGITDRTTTTTDPYLRPFARAVRDGSDLVMVSSAIYSRIDPGTNAVFSRPIITDLLRRQLGYRGVVITDDVGAAKSVAGVPIGQRATRFITAGGDIVLTARPSDIPVMHDALTARMATDQAFASQVTAATTRVVALKLRMGLARCP